MEKSQTHKAEKVSSARKTKGLSYRGSSSKAIEHLIQDGQRRKGWRKRGRNGRDGMKSAEVAASSKTAQVAGEEWSLEKKSL